MKQLLILLILLLLITACGKEEAPTKLPEKPDTFYVPPPAPAPLPIPELTPPIIPEPQLPTPEPLPPTAPEPLPPPVPEPLPPPVQDIPGSCEIFGIQGMQYTMEDVNKGKISMQDFSDLNVCYPYFSPDQANTQAVCCTI